MQVDPGYLERKNEEIALIARELGKSRRRRVRTIEGAIEEKFRLGAELRARYAQRTWDNTETSWKPGAVLRSGPFTFSYRYQRADLTVAGPFPYGSPGHFAGMSVSEPIYTCSGMAAISAVLLAGAVGTERPPPLLHLAECYQETLEAAAACAGFKIFCLNPEKSWRALRPPRPLLWLDCLPFGEKAKELQECAGDANLVVFDTTAFPARSGRIRRFLQWARRVRSPVVLVRSHTKLDTLGIEYGRLGSAVFVTFPEVPLIKLALWRNVARSTPDIVRLLGNAALPGHFCPYADGSAYARLASRRSAAILHNSRLVGRILARHLGRAGVRQYRHGAFAALVPPRHWEGREATAEAANLAAALADRGLPVQHAGSFGFDFTAVDGFFDTAVERYLLRIAAADLPAAISAEIAHSIAAWWTRRWRSRVASGPAAHDAIVRRRSGNLSRPKPSNKRGYPVAAGGAYGQ